MKTAITTAIVLASLALVACDKPQDAKPTEPAAPTTTATAAPVAPANTTTNTTGAAQGKTGDAVMIADTDLATPADYEAQAETTITSKNYKSQIASLEAEIGKE